MPITISFSNISLKSLLYYSIGCLYLSICLGISQRRIIICCTRALKKAFEVGIVKLVIVINDDGMRDSESVDDTYFNKVR